MLMRQRWDEEDPLRQKYTKTGYQPITARDEAKLATTFTLSQSDTASLPPGDVRSFRLAVDMALQYKPLTADQTEKLKALAISKRVMFSRDT